MFKLTVPATGLAYNGREPMYFLWNCKVMQRITINALRGTKRIQIKAANRGFLENYLLTRIFTCILLKLGLLRFAQAILKATISA